MMIESPTQLGELIRATRREAGLRQDDLALAAGTGRRFISELERGKSTAQIAPVLRVLWVLGLRVEIDKRPRPRWDVGGAE